MEEEIFQETGEMNSNLDLRGQELNNVPLKNSKEPPDLPTMQYSFSISEIFVTFVIMLSTFSGGYLEGYTSAALPSLLHPNHSYLEAAYKPSFLASYNNSSNSTAFVKSNSTTDSLSNLIDEVEGTFVITEEQGSWVGSLLLLGAATGSLFSSWAVGMGRRTALLWSSGPRLASWLLVAFASNPLLLYVGRFLSGLSIGAISSAAPIYISEIAHPTFRGSLSCLVLLGVNAGMLAASVFGTFLQWRGLALVGVGTVLLYLVPTFCIPQSPSWLLVEGKPHEARDALKKLRRRGYCVQNEIEQLMASASSSKTNKNVSWKDLFTERRTLLPFCTMMLVTIVNRLSGYNAIITFCTVFMRRIVPSVSEYWASVTVCLIQVSGTLGAMLLVDFWGRRKLLLLSMFLMGLSLVVMASVAGFSLKFKDFDGTWISFLATMLYIGAYSIGVGPLTWVLLGELFPMDARERATALVSFCNWSLAFLVTKTFFNLQSSVGIAWTCGLYSLVCLTGFIASSLLVPETKGRSLSQVETLFAYSSSRNWLATVQNAGEVALSSITANQAYPEDTYSTFR